MELFGVGSVTFMIGLMVGLVGWLAAMAILVRYDVHKSFGFQAGMRRLFSGDPQAKVDRRKAGRRLAVMAAGMLALLMSVFIGDVQRNRPCRDACRGAGYETGLFRGSPHESVNGRAVGPAQCWCRRGSAWSDAPLDVAEP